MKKTEKYRIMSKKSIFGQTYMKLAVAMETSKMMDTPLTYQNFWSTKDEWTATESFSP